MNTKELNNKLITEKEKPLTPQDKVHIMADKNPNVIKLIKEFNLQLL